MKTIKTEADVKTLVKDWFDRRNAWHYAPIQTGMGAHGIHDRIGCVPITVTRAMVGKTIGLFVSVESKAPGRRGEKDEGLTSGQRDNLKDIIAASGISIRCDCAQDLMWLDSALLILQMTHE